jgi:putative FmdB family regulatory protein
MPLYEYICQDCGIKFDTLRPIKDADKPLECTRCQSPRTTRQLSVFFAQSGGKAVAGTQSGGCGGCSGGSCASCSH